jgi:hypothetical protein
LPCSMLNEDIWHDGEYQNGVMWYCSLCDLDLGEISAISKENDHPACPYCHGVVEEERTRPADEVEILAMVKWNNYPNAVFANASEQSVYRIFDIIANSLENSQYREYKEDIIQIVKDAFEPHTKIANEEIAKILIDNFKRADAELDHLY